MKKILIVDDQEDVRELVGITLDIGDYEIFQAEDGPTAFDMIKSKKPDMVLLDVMMPKGGMDGFELCNIVKQDQNLKHIKIIMLTARGQETDKIKGQEAGADDYFTKPFSPLDLINKVEEILND